ncbi:MAG TPA: hypothetical protein VNQ77_00985 [Frankiaceae bacterium]|nr:hypothetical protein [Frankiaceae bacterium]
MRHPTHRKRPQRRLICGLVTAAAVVVSALTVPVGASAEDPRILSTTVVFPTGQPAAGAEVELVTGTSDPAADGTPLTIMKAVADANGAVSFDVPATPELIDRAQHEGGRLRTVLSSTARQGTVEQAEADLSLYFKRVSTVWLTYEPQSGTFSVPVVDVQALRPLPVFDATVIEQLGETTLAQVGTLADMSSPWVLHLKSRLEAEMAKRGYIANNDALAYNVNTLDGTMTWVTYSPQTIIARPVTLPGEEFEYGTYEILPMTTRGIPAVDTTDAGDAVDDVALTAGADTTSKKERGRWGRHDNDCFTAGVSNSNGPRSERTVCWQIDHQVMDTTKGRSYWQYEMDASGAGVRGNKMSKLWVHSRPYFEKAASQYRDGQNIPTHTYSSTEGCDTSTDEISVESGSPIKIGAKHRWTRTTCETYSPKAYSNSGEHASIWYGNDSVKELVYRHVAMKTPVYTATSAGSPLWHAWSGQWVSSGG